MNNENITASDEATLEMDETLENILYFCIDEAKQKKAELKDYAPFLVSVEGENMTIDEFSGDEKEEIRTQARKLIEDAPETTTHYAFCYDGFLDLETDGKKKESHDCIIVECASSDMESSYAIVLEYSENDDKIVFEKNPVFAGNAKTFFAS